MLSRDTTELRSQLIERLHAHEEQADFLKNASRLVASATTLAMNAHGLDETLASVARFTLPHPNVWSILDLRHGEGHDSPPRRVAVLHPDPLVQSAAATLIDGWPPPRDRRGAPSVWRTGRTEIIAELSDDALAKVAGSREQLTALRALHVGAVMVVPLRVRDDTIGSLTFIGPRGGRAFDNADRVLAEQIAAGAAFAIDNAMRADERARSIAAAEVALAERLAFMSSLSHGLRTPLHAIFGYAQLLAEGVRGPLTGDQQHDVQRIQANERHLLNLVDSVIAFARWDDGENLITEDVPVHDAVASARRATEASAAARHIISGVSGDSVDRDIYVRADATRLEEILLQLMTNAVRFSRPGATVTVDARVVGDCVWIRVTDTGIGIAEEDLGLVFQPFVRGRNALARAEEGRREGRGLGLAISRKLARAMGGEVSVVSQEGVGSAFTLALPRGRAPHAGNE
ncbi:MAG TPA: HAMP domain-containing sensor histidine kinase [Gemmatimonadaceae bacterium]|nr:HAMP domain-containing sensor histidine kinase [Gemmatimonadaceae bacterium]